MEQVFSDSLGWFVFFICTWLALFAFPSSVKGYVKHAYLIGTMIALTVLIFAVHVLFAVYVDMPSLGRTLFVLVFFSGFTLFPIFSAYKQLLPHTLRKDKVYEMTPDKFGYTFGEGKYRMVLKGHLFEGDRRFDVVLWSDIESNLKPDLSKPLVLLYEQTGIFLSKTQKQALKNATLKLNVKITHHDQPPFKTPVVCLFNIGSQL